MQAKENDITFIILASTILIIFLVVLITTILYLHQRRQLYYFRKIDTLKQEFEKELLSTQLELHENILQNFSREIHDNIGLSLTLAKLNLNTLTLDLSNNSYSKIQTTITLLSKAIGDLRNISKGLNSDRINNLGLIKSIEEEIEAIRATKLIKVELSTEGEILFLDSPKELIIFRIIQESLNNIIKHSNASIVNILLCYHEKDFCLKIIDNGIGFNASAQSLRKGSGLYNINSRVKVLNGSFEINSSNKGTHINISIPY